MNLITTTAIGFLPLTLNEKMSPLSKDIKLRLVFSSKTRRFKSNSIEIYLDNKKYSFLGL